MDTTQLKLATEKKTHAVVLAGRRVLKELTFQLDCQIIINSKWHWHSPREKYENDIEYVYRKSLTAIKALNGILPNKEGAAVANDLQSPRGVFRSPICYPHLG